MNLFPQRAEICRAPERLLSFTVSCPALRSARSLILRVRL
jgi:hypothetical protein